MISFFLRGMRVEIHFLFIGILTLFLLLDKTGTAALGLLASLMHETGHILAFAVTGYRPERISFELTGICLQKKSVQMSYGKELIVLLAGSGTNLLVFFLCLLGAGGDLNRLGLFGTIHLLLGLVNLLPVSALDGGKVLHVLLIQFFPIRTALRIEGVVQGALITVFTLAGIISVLAGRANFTVLVFCAYMITMLITAH